VEGVDVGEEAVGLDIGEGGFEQGDVVAVGAVDRLADGMP